MKRAADTILNPERIVRYLLGESLSETDQAEIELRLFGDDEFLEELQAIELQLMARYLRNDLSTRERELFESHFLLSRERRNALEFVRGLSNALGTGEQTYDAESEIYETSIAALNTHRPGMLPSHSLPKLNRSRYFSWMASRVGLAAGRMRIAALGIAAALVVGIVLYSFRGERTAWSSQTDLTSSSGSLQTAPGILPEDHAIQGTMRPSQPDFIRSSPSAQRVTGILPEVPAISPDGQYVASSVQTGGKSAIWIRPISEVQARPWREPKMERRRSGRLTAGTSRSLLTEN